MIQNWFKYGIEFSANVSKQPTDTYCYEYILVISESQLLLTLFAIARGGNNIPGG